jgi:hypothetical protein
VVVLLAADSAIAIWLSISMTIFCFAGGVENFCFAGGVANSCLGGVLGMPTAGQCSMFWCVREFPMRQIYPLHPCTLLVAGGVVNFSFAGEVANLCFSDGVTNFC